MDQIVRGTFQCRNRISGPMRSRIQDKWVMCPSFLVGYSHFRLSRAYSLSEGTSDPMIPLRMLPKVLDVVKVPRHLNEQFQMIQWSRLLCRDWSPRPENC